MTVFIEALNKALEPYHMRSHVGMIRIIESGIKFHTAQRVAREYGPCNAMSLQIMASGLSVIHDSEFSRTMVENMYDEIGGAKPEDSHILMFAKFMSAVGMDPHTEMSALGRRMVNTFLDVKHETSEHQALALMHGFEAVFPYVCGGIYKAIMKSQVVSEEAAFFFIHHAEADVYHSDRMLQTLDKKTGGDLVKQIQCIERSVKGAKAVHAFFDEILGDGT